jgi:hypothetical protein
MNLLDLESSLTAENISPSDAFGLLQEIARHLAEDPEAERTQDLVILALDRKDSFPENLHPIIDAFVVELGLYPYLDPVTLCTADLIRYEFNRPLDFDKDLVFHRAQSEVYRLLMEGESVVLNAPTSFGKSLLIDAVVGSSMYDNIAIVVPTIALLDETRRRLERFKSVYRIITHPSQRLGRRNVFVLTQERLLEFNGLPSIDFFVIDEFYKLSPRRGDERYTLLNVALYRLMKTARAFYMLGPNVLGVDPSSAPSLRARLISSPIKTVATLAIKVPKQDRNLEGLVRICNEQDAASLIYCGSPDSARDVAKELAKSREESADQSLLQAAAWIDAHYHSEWSFAQCLRKGIGLHHGRIPRALLQMAVRLFDEGKLKFLVCTATLIEGVNTTAKNVMVYDKKIGGRNFDFFTFANIRGRAGRMSRHFVGRVFLFQDPPKENLEYIDIPVLSQPENLSMDVIVEMDDEDLQDFAKDRLADLQSRGHLPLTLIRQSLGVDPERQMEFGRMVQTFSDQDLIELGWVGRPNGPQMDRLCQLVWEGFIADPNSKKQHYRISSAHQLAARLRLASALSVREWIERDAALPDADPDKVVEDILDFVRNWCGFLIPRYGGAVERIVKFEQSRRGLPEGNYSLFLGQVETAFLPPMVAALDEYGVPTQISQRLNAMQSLPPNLDDAADEMRKAVANGLFSPFEEGMVSAALGTSVVGQGRLDFSDPIA